MSEQDARWVEKVVQGDDRAFDELVKRHRERVIASVYSKVDNLDTALDLAQEAFVRAYISLETLRDPCRFGAWAVGIAENLCLMHRRKQRELAVSNEFLDRFDSDILPTILPGFDSLAPGTRAVAERYFGQSLPMKDIAEELRISLSAVKSRIRDARRNLQKEMQPVKTEGQPKRKDFDQELKRRLELAKWFRQFAFKAKNGIPLLQLLDELSHDDFSKAICDATKKMRELVLESGASMTSVMRQLPVFITPETSAMVRAGEIGGILDEAAEILADWIDVSSAKKDIELSFWLRSLGSLIEAGVPVEMAFAWGVEYPVSPAATEVLQNLIQGLQRNQPLAPIIESSGVVFPHPIRLAIRAGEQGECLGYAFRWAGREIATQICSRLIGMEPSFKNRSTQVSEQRFIETVAGFTTSDVADDRRSSLSILCSLEAREHLDLVERCLCDEDASVRIQAIKTLALLGSSSNASLLEQRLGDESSEVRREVIIALADLRAAHLAEKIAWMLRDPDYIVKTTAMDAVVRLGELDTLVRVSSEILLSDDSQGKMYAAIVLLDHPEMADVSVLVHALSEPMPVAIRAALALSKLGRAECLPLLREALATGWWSYETAQALIRMKDMESAQAIRDAVGRGELHPIWLERVAEMEAG